MAQFGCGGSRCTCQVVAGPGVTVTGNGSAGAPYVIESEAGSVTCDQVRPCLSAGPGATYDPATGVIGAETTLVEAGDNVTVTGTGAAGDPYVVAAEAADPTVVQAGDRATVTGTGTAGDPYVVSADPPSCEDVRPCLVAGDGIDYDAATGVVAARPSTDAGNGLGFGTDGGLLVPAAEPLTAGCGLTGDGSAGAPLSAAVAAWPYACDLDANAGGVYCDSAGQLRSEPRPLATFVQDQQVLNPANLVVPTPQDTVVAEHTLVIDNPDPCRPAFVMVEGEADADFNLPPGSGAALGITTDEMSYVANNGATTLLDVHVQGTKVVHTTIPAGGSINFTITITMGRGSGGATYNRVQSYLRAFVFVL